MVPQRKPSSMFFGKPVAPNQGQGWEIELKHMGHAESSLPSFPDVEPISNELAEIQLP